MVHEPAALTYPWGSLARVTRAAARNAGAFHRQFHSDTLAHKLCDALSRWLGVPVSTERLQLRPMLGEPDGPSVRLRFRLPAGTGEVIACLEPRLVTRLVGFALEREAILQNPLASVEPELVGAAAAIVSKIIDDSEIDFDLEFATQPAHVTDAERVQLDMTLHVGSTAYPFVLGIIVQWLPLPEQKHARRLTDLGELDLELPLVVGASRITREELSRLGLGTAFLTGSGLFIDASRVGRAVLAAPDSERGHEVHLQPDGKIVLGERAVTLELDDTKPPNHSAPEAETLVDTLFQAPVVVRVEMGTVSLPAKDWASLRAGDILETGQPLSADITLRVAGKAVAEGQLLNIEGELGVRITKLLVGEET